MAQLAHGAREIIDKHRADIRFLRTCLSDGIESVRRNPDKTTDLLEVALRVLRAHDERFEDEIVPRMQRAENRAAERAVIDELLERVARLENSQ